jgi:hypothetical protein
MYAGGMPPLPGIPRGWPAETCAWLSSGESTGLLSSTPLASPDVGSGAFKQACSVLALGMRQGIGNGAHLNKVLAFGLGYKRL